MEGDPRAAMAGSPRTTVSKWAELLFSLRSRLRQQHDGVTPGVRTLEGYTLLKERMKKATLIRNEIPEQEGREPRACQRVLRRLQNTTFYVDPARCWGTAHAAHA